MNVFVGVLAPKPVSRGTPAEGGVEFDAAAAADGGRLQRTGFDPTGAAPRPPSA